MVSSARGALALLIVVCAAQFILQLDFSVVNLTLQRVRVELGFSPAGLQWIVTGYAMTFGSLLLFGGRAGDQFGQRRILLIGLVVFGIASIACGLAVSATMLVVARVVQGAGGALIAPSALSALTAAFPDGPARVRALGIWQATTAAGGTTGILVGGALVEFVGWRSVFLINIPIVIGLLIAVPLTLRHRSGRRVGSLLLAPSLVVTAAIASLIVGLSNSEAFGFGSIQALAAFAVAVALGLVFWATQRRTSTPLVDPELWKSRQRRGALVAMLITGGVLASYVYFASLYLQTVLDFNPFTTGIALLPATVAIVLVSSLAARRVIDRLGLRITALAGATSLTVGQFWFSFISAHGTYALNVLPALLFTSVGIGLILPAVSVAATANVAAGSQGAAASLLTTGQQIGAAIGVASLATVAAARSRETGMVSEGFSTAFLVSTALMIVVALVMAFMFSRRRDAATAAA
jgi:EmrB/QacA subfamily drug resistance transporter